MSYHLEGAVEEEIMRIGLAALSGVVVTALASPAWAIKVVPAGDSITVGYADSAYGNYLQLALDAADPGKYVVEPVAVGGVNTEMYINNGYVTTVVNKHPDVIILMLGANDSVRIASDPTYTLQSFKNNYTSILNSFAAARNEEGHSSIVIMSTVTPRLDGGQAPGNIIANDIDPWLRSEAASRELRLVDSYADIQAQPSWQSFYNLPTDVIHPYKYNSAAGKTGYQWMGGNFCAAVMQAVETDVPRRYVDVTVGDDGLYDGTVPAGYVNGSHGPWKTISKALNAAPNDTRVQVAEGHYVEDQGSQHYLLIGAGAADKTLTVEGTGTVTVTSESGQNYLIRTDGSAGNATLNFKNITFQANDTASSMVYLSADTTYGAEKAVSVLFRGCTLDGKTAGSPANVSVLLSWYVRGAQAMANGDPVLVRNVKFVDSTLRPKGVGTAIQLVDAASLTVTGCTISQDLGDIIGLQGVVHEVDVSDNPLLANDATNGTSGGGLMTGNGNRLERCDVLRFAGNVVDVGGGGVRIEEAVDRIQIEDNQITVTNTSGAVRGVWIGLESPTAWAAGTQYVPSAAVQNPIRVGGVSVGTAYFRCIQTHTAGANDEPGAGGNWTSYWRIVPRMGGVVCRNNRITVSGLGSHCGLLVGATGGGGRYWSNTIATNGTAMLVSGEDNNIHHNSTSGSIGCSLMGGQRNSIQSNTFYCTAGPALRWQKTFREPSNNIITDNIFDISGGGTYCIQDVTGTGGTYGHWNNLLDYNCYNSAGGTLASLKGAAVSTLKGLQDAWKNVTWGTSKAWAGNDTHSLTADPRFTNPAAGDFSLSAGSPCAGTGSTQGINIGATQSHSTGDLDNDGDVDGFDFLTFANCYNGSSRPPRCQ
jgi:lysophospholipase L1-like esterase